MTLEQLIEHARSKYTPEEKAAREEIRRHNMDVLNKRLSKEFNDSIVTEELLNKVISL